MNVGLPSETIKNAAIRIKELERENATLRTQLSDTVTTKYHDEIVQEAINEKVKLTNELRNQLRVAEAFHRVAVMERDALIEENAALRTQNEELFSGLVVAEREMEGCLNNGKLPAWSLDCVRAVISKVSLDRIRAVTSEARKEAQP